MKSVNGMMTFGDFIFELKSLPYQDLKRNQGWRHPTNSRVGLRPARQFIGADDESITLSGVLYPEITGGPVQLGKLRMLANRGQPESLIQGDGTVFGEFVVTSLEETRSFFFADGLAKKIEFTVTFARVDDRAQMQQGANRKDQSTYRVNNGQAEVMGPVQPGINRDPIF